MDRDEELPISVRLAMCSAERERDASGCRSSGITPELSVLVASWCWFRRCCFRRRFVFRRCYRGCNVKHIAIAISCISLASFVFARCGGYEKALDFTRAGHRIVQSALLPSFLFAAPEAYRCGRLSEGYAYIVMKLNKIHFNSCTTHVLTTLVVTVAYPRFKRVT